ncbi:type VII secretion protein EccB [Actinophytocola oryzae]|uniref:Type VII secretion protein EccB n=1 Tax=Actinophytocola oryzae TaxID=502181 RepID=A0A4R7V0T3_9PSEU|nr:type VII secretion protein EccB [Actinophytocola oryzae]TDV42164.1 type VII secretion protein EccB [Actinophytocola oryzae]
MQSKRDQVQAYFFVVGRLVSAVVHGRPDALAQPNKRLNTGTFLGVILGGVLMGVFGIIGLFVPGGNVTWRQPGAIVMNEDTGARYVFLDDQLRPVLNYSSARLAAGKSGGQVFKVSQKSLADTPVGQPIGIPGAPDALPAANALDNGPWTACAQEGGTGAQATGPTSTLLIGQSFDLTVVPSQALLVRAPDETTFLVWQGKRHLIPGRAEATALGYGGVDPVDVTAAWLNPIPQGRDFEVRRTPDTGAPGPDIDGEPSVVGQIYLVRNPAIGADQLYLVRSDGLTPLSPTVAALLLAAPFTKEAYPDSAVTPIEVGPGALSGVPSTNSGPDLVEGLPQMPPEIVTPTPDDSACVAFFPVGKGEMRVVTGFVPATVHKEAMPVAAHEEGVTTDRVLIPAGGGVLVREQQSPEAALNAVYLVTETGVKYPLANSDVVQALGYSAQSAVAMPGEMLALLPTGPVLSVEAALSAQQS